MFIDVNCSLGNWPFAPFQIRDADALARHLQGEAVDAALVSSVDALFVADPSDHNSRLLNALLPHENLYPVPVLNLRTRTWQRELGAYEREPTVRAVKIHPNYHNYEVRDPEVTELAAALIEAGLPLIVALRVADERLHDPRVQVPGVPVDQVAELARFHPRLPVVCTNAYRSEIVRANGPENLYFDIAFAEYYKTVRSLAAHVPVTNLLFGSHTPFFVTRAASMKVAWCELPEQQRTQVAAATARRVFRIAEDREGGSS
jgi:uncharacterized protein